MDDSSARFTKTVENYVKYRPSYPKEVLDVLINECHLVPNSIIADIGSGPGNLAKLFLDYGNTVFAVEPNQAMREAAEKLLSSFTHFHSVSGSAEATTLEDHSVDFITAGTSFHWFDPIASKVEFQRILRRRGWVLLVWNVRDKLNSDLVNDYENLLIEYCTDYKNSKAQEFDKTAMAEFFAPFKMHSKSFTNNQQFDWEGLKGRLLSTSYALTKENAHYDEMLRALKKIFDRHQVEGIVNFPYQAKLYYGQI